MFEALKNHRMKVLRSFDATVAALLLDGDTENADEVSKSRQQFRDKCFEKNVDSFGKICYEHKMKNMRDYQAAMTCPNCGDTDLCPIDCSLGRCNKCGVFPDSLMPSHELSGVVEGEEDADQTTSRSEDPSW